MELYGELLARMLDGGRMQVTFPDLHLDAAELVRLRCYQALEQIRDILRDDHLDDRACCGKIEAIVSLFEGMGTGCGGRHGG